MRETLLVATGLLVLCFLSLTGFVTGDASTQVQAASNSEAPQIPWLLLAAVIAAPFIVGLTLGAIIRKRRGLSFF